MSELVVAALKVAFLLLVWLFIVFALQVIRTDLRGREVSASSAELALAAPRQRRRRAPRNAPGVLTVVEGRQTGLRIPMAGVVGIGRAPDSALQIDDDYASTRHAQLVTGDDGHWYLEDLRSTNGTLLNDRAISDRVKVTAGDVIKVGRTTMRLEKQK